MNLAKIVGDKVIINKGHPSYKKSLDSFMKFSLKIALQVNMHFGPKTICGAGSIERNDGDKKFALVYAPNLPGLLRKVKRKYGIPLEMITLTFQPE